MPVRSRSYAQLPPEVRAERIEIHVLDRSADAMVVIVAGAPLCRAEPQPVGRPVAGSLETVAVHEGFQRMNGMPILGLPVGANASCQNREHVAGHCLLYTSPS